MESSLPSRKKPSRRFHHKSRSGCRQCRGRKTKCDEAKPRCQKCIARGLVCSFVESSLVIIPTRPKERRSVHSHSNTLVTKISKPPVSVSGQLRQLVVRAPHLELQLPSIPKLRLQGNDTDAMRLMHHYTMYTCNIIANSVDMVPLWQSFVPQIAFQHDFLLHGLLAVTALHLNIEDPTPEHTNAALQHYTKSLALFRPHVGNITPDNVTALFALSCLLPLYSFGLKATSLTPIDSISEIIEVFALMRGILTIVKDGCQWLLSTPFSKVMAVVIDDTSCLLPFEIETTLSLLATQNEQTPLMPYRKLYEQSITVLRETLARVQDPIYDRMTVAPFPLKVPEEFFDALRERQPMALVILAHYGVVLYQLRGEIWLRGWGSRIVDAVKYSLGEEWSDCLAWPIRELEKVCVNGLLKIQ